MRYVKAVTLIGGVLLLAIAVSDVASRRAEAADARQRSIGLSARLAAARLDGRLANAVATLASAPATWSPDRVSSALDAEVCSPQAASRCDVDQASADLAAEAATATGSAAVVVDAGRLLVAADRDPFAMAVVLAVSDSGDGSVLHRLGLPPAGADPAATAALDTDFVSGRWALTIDSGAVDPGTGAFDAASVAAIAALLVIGGAAVTWAMVAIARDHRGLRRRATTDSLTGLPNRAEFERRAIAMLSRAEHDGSGACLVLVDLDRFKEINDTVGHAAGDRVLVEAAGRLRRAVRESDIVGRWGGDEFVLLLAGVGDPLAVPDRVAAIGASLAGVPTMDGRELTASLGAASAPLEGADITVLLEVADRAMYRNKTAATGVSARRLS